MSFISWQYLLFLPLFFLLYWTLSGKRRLLLLVAASYVFYAFWDVRFLALALKGPHLARGELAAAVTTAPLLGLTPPELQPYHLPLSGESRLAVLAYKL